MMRKPLDHTPYTRTARRLLDKCKAKSRRTIRFEDGKVLYCLKSKHRTDIARRWRTFWRLKRITRTRKD